MIESRREGWAGHVVRIGENRNAYRILMGKPERRPLGASSHGWVNIKMDLGEIGMDWIHLAQDKD
jgi:hypothetical protein